MTDAERAPESATPTRRRPDRDHALGCRGGAPPESRTGPESTGSQPSRPDGSPHLMPIIAFWVEDAFHFLVGEGTRKGRNLAADARCVVGTGNMTLPSMDLIVEGLARGRSPIRLT